LGHAPGYPSRGLGLVSGYLSGPHQGTSHNCECLLYWFAEGKEVDMGRDLCTQAEQFDKFFIFFSEEEVKFVVWSCDISKILVRMALISVSLSF